MSIMHSNMHYDSCVEDTSSSDSDDSIKDITHTGTTIRPTLTTAMPRAPGNSSLQGHRDSPYQLLGLSTVAQDRLPVTPTILHTSLPETPRPTKGRPRPKHIIRQPVSPYPTTPASQTTSVVCDRDGNHYYDGTGQLLRGPVISSPPPIPFHEILMDFDTLDNPFADSKWEVANKHKLIVNITGPRFPSIPRDLDYNIDVEGRFRELNVPHPNPEEFRAAWNDTKIYLTHGVVVHPEHQFRGAVYRLYPPNVMIVKPVKRLTPIHIGDNHSHDTMYMATICRAVTDEYALIQLDAYKSDGHRLHPEHKIWPRLSLVIHHKRNLVPLPPNQMDYYLTNPRRQLNNTVIFNNQLVL